MTSDKIEVFAKVVLDKGMYPPKPFPNPSYWWHQKARNGEIVCSSETFDNVQNARRAAKAQAKKLGGVKVVDLTRGK